MKIEIKIPSVGESVTEAIVSNILKPNGSMVKEDEEIVELETDKVNQVLSAPKAGQLTLTVKEGQEVVIGEVIGYVDTEAKGAAPSPERAPQEKSAPPSQEGPSARKNASDFVAELHQEPKTLPKPPEREYKEEKEEGVTRKKMTPLRKTIAAKLVQAQQQSAMLTTFNEVDMSKIIEIRQNEKEKFLQKNGVKLGFMSFFVKAAVSALKAVPEVNASLEGDEILFYHTYHIGVAVSTEKGLMVPVVRECDLLSFGEVEGAIESFAKKARDASISIDDLRGGSFTITNGGIFGSLLSTPILNPPQSAILGMHKIEKRAVVVDNTIVIRPMMYLALSYDHRIIDGKEAVRFLVHIKDALEDPARLLLDI